MSGRVPRRAPETLHRRIQADIERRILSGAWRPGHRIPFEHELMEQYDCARMTANKAVAGLAAAGLIVRRRRVGSFVADPRTHAVVIEIPDIQASIVARGQRYALELISRRVREPNAQRTHEVILAQGGQLLALACLHRADERPFALEQRLISVDAVPEALGVDFARQAPGSWLLGHVAWTQAEHRIRALNASRDIAARLNIEERDACLELERRTWRARRHITHVRQIFPGADYDLVARFEPKTTRVRTKAR